MARMCEDMIQRQEIRNPLEVVEALGQRETDGLQPLPRLLLSRGESEYQEEKLARVTCDAILRTKGLPRPKLTAEAATKSFIRKGKPMNIVTVGIDLAKNVFALHGVDQSQLFEMDAIHQLSPANQRH